MKKKTGLFILSLGLWFVFNILVMSNNIQAHETAHMQFALYNGCEEYDISFNLWEPYFQCLEYSDQRFPEAEYILDGYNEIIQYSFTTHYLYLGFMGILITVVIILKD